MPALLASIALAELGLRVLQPAAKPATHGPGGESERGLLHTRSSTPGLTYELGPSRDVVYQGARVVTNSLGMRGGEVPMPKPEHELRIAALGDSITFGWAVEYEQCWPALLERSIRAQRPCSVLDLAVSGYSTRDEAIVLRAKALALDPDVVVVGYFLNDPQFEAISPLHLWFREAPWWKRTRLWTLFNQWSLKRERRDLGGGDYYRWLHHPEGAPWRSASAALADMAAAARERDVAVLVAIFPTWFGFDDLARYPYDDLHAQVAAEVERNGMRSLDLMTAYRASGSPVAELKVDDEHPSARGHEIAARAIEARLEELKWLTPRR